MIDALHISQSGLRATQKWIDAISNNVANLQTPGFKRTTVQFVDLVRGNDASADTQGRDDAAVGLGTRMTSASNFSSGTVQATNNPLDFSIQGQGFLEVLTPSGSPAYTRLGRLKVDVNGRLVSASGLPLSDDIRISPDVASIEISADGAVKGRLGNGSILDLGQIRLARITNPEAMHAVGDGLFTISTASGEATLHTPASDGLGALVQGHIEMSNVDLIEEMSGLMLAQRAYQLNARIIQTADQVMETINNLRR